MNIVFFEDMFAIETHSQVEFKLSSFYIAILFCVDFRFSVLQSQHLNYKI